MITNAVKSMLPQLIELWKECFGDSEEYISFFFSNNLQGTDRFENLYVYVENGKPVSMLTVLEAELVSEGESDKFWYIYGVATAKEHCKKGYAGRLLLYVLSKVEENGAVAGLVPANQSLFAYYKKFGFETFFYKRVWEYSAEQAGTDENITEKYRISHVSEKQYNRMRNETFAAIPHIKWSDHAVAYAIEENEKLGGETLRISSKNEDYFVMYYFYDRILYVRETNAPMQLLGKMVSNLCKKHALEKAIVSMACDFSMIGNEVPHGMIYKKSEKYKFPYFGLALD